MLRILNVTGLILVLEVTGWTLFPVAGHIWRRILVFYLSHCRQTLEHNLKVDNYVLFSWIFQFIIQIKLFTVTRVLLLKTVFNN